MTIKVSLTSSAKIAGGRAVSTAQVLECTADDYVQVVVPGIDKTDPDQPMSHASNASMPSTLVGVYPASEGWQLLALWIASDRYTPDLVYSVVGGTENVRLDAPQFFIGQGALGLLMAPPEQLVFKNGGGKGVDCRVSILACRRGETSAEPPAEEPPS
ncbi:MAG: hypothetical protein WBG92_19910 [Thiohalocapsa sp.]